MGVLHTGKEKNEDFLKKARLKKRKQKKRPPRKRGKNKLLLQLTIPSCRGRKK